MKPWCLLEALNLVILEEPDLKPWQNPRGTLPQTTPQPSQNLVEPWWNPRGTLPSQNLVERWWNPRGTLPQTTPDHPTALAELGGTLEPSLDPRLVEPQTTPDHPAALVLPQTTPPRSPCNLAELCLNPRGTLPQTLPDHPAALVEPGGTLVEPS